MFPRARTRPEVTIVLQLICSMAKGQSFQQKAPRRRIRKRDGVTIWQNYCFVVEFKHALSHNLVMFVFYLCVAFVEG